MNYLAHITLSKPTTESLIGNLLGDFCKGVAVDTLSGAVSAGLANHRAVDRFTDTHPLVKQAKAEFSATRRRFAGVALDVLFDHLLIRHWPCFYRTDFVSFKQQVYQRLAQAEPLMPESMQQVMRKVRLYDWFAQYQQLADVGVALDNIARRIRFSNQFSGMLDEIRPLYPQLEQSFLQFYPQLIQHVISLNLEQQFEPADTDFLPLLLR